MTAPRLTRRQAAIIGLFTGTCCGPFEDIQYLAEELADEPVMTHVLAARWDELKEMARPLFLSICAEARPGDGHGAGHG